MKRSSITAGTLDVQARQQFHNLANGIDSAVELGQAVIKIGEAADAMMRAGINRRALRLLLADASGVTKADVGRVLQALVDLRKTYCR